MNQRVGCEIGRICCFVGKWTRKKEDGSSHSAKFPYLFPMVCMMSRVTIALVVVLDLPEIDPSLAIA